jgi:hypothetical protein
MRKHRNRRHYEGILLILTITIAACLLIDTGSLLSLYRNDDRNYSEIMPREPVFNKAGYYLPRVDSLLSQGEHILPSDRISLLQKEYDTATKEIQMRLEQESLLFSYKFSLIGAILAVLLIRGYQKSSQKHRADSSSPLLLGRSPESIVIFWAAVITSGIIDSRILYHADMTVTLGKWIRDYVEPVLLGRNITGWETYLSAKSLLIGSTVYPLLRINTSILTLSLFAAVNYMLRYSDPVRYDIPLGKDDDSERDKEFKLSFYGSISAFLVFSLVSIHYHYNDGTWIVWTFILFAIGVVSSYLLWHPSDSGNSA